MWLAKRWIRVERALGQGYFYTGALYSVSGLRLKDLDVVVEEREKLEVLEVLDVREHGLQPCFSV